MSKLVFAIAAAVALSSFATGAARAQEWRTVAVGGVDHNVSRTTVRYGDLDLTTSQGAQALQRRIHVAARQVCSEPPTIADLAEYAVYRNCAQEAERAASPQMERAIAQARATVLASYGFR